MRQARFDREFAAQPGDALACRCDADFRSAGLRAGPPPSRTSTSRPPSATKTPFDKNRLLAAPQVQSAAAFRAADELVLKGYSAPATDLTVTTLIATQFKGKTIVPVNPDTDIIQRAKEPGRPP